MERYKIHFTDGYGGATITCDSDEQYNEVLANLRDDPMAEDIWVETYDPDEGWQA